MKLYKKLAILKTRNARLLTVLDTTTQRKDLAISRANRAQREFNELNHTSHYWKEALEALNKAEAKLKWLKSKIKVVQTKIEKNFKEQDFIQDIQEHKISKDETTPVDFAARTRANIVGKITLPPERKKKRNPARQAQIDRDNAQIELSKRQTAKRRARAATRAGQK